MSSNCEGFAVVKQDAQADYPVDSDHDSFTKTVIGDDALPYLSKRSRGIVYPLVGFSVSCAICRKDSSKVCELCYYVELCFINFHDVNHEGALTT